MFKLFYAACALILTFLSALLLYEYVTLRDHVRHLATIRQEYQANTIAFRKLLRDCQRIKETEEEAASYEDDEKKKQSFLVLNREPAYLKESMAQYLIEQRLDPSYACMYDTDEKNYGSTIKTRRSVRIQRSKGRTSLVMRQISRRRIRHDRRVKDISFIWPVDRSDFWISSFYGARRKPDRTWGFHSGIDLAALKGTPVKAAQEGVVVEAGVNTGYGNTIVLAHNNKYKTRYAHLHKIYVRCGQRVSQGQQIGEVGDTGLVRKRGRSASHLHFEVYAHSKRVDPIYFFV